MTSIVNVSLLCFVNVLVYLPIFAEVVTIRVPKFRKIKVRDRLVLQLPTVPALSPIINPTSVHFCNGWLYCLFLS